MATPVGATLSPAAALPRLPDSTTLEDLFAALDVGTVSKPAEILVDSASLLSRCVNALALSGAGAISVDLEGVNLCREGRVALLQLYSEKFKIVWIVDVTTLGRRAFEKPEGSTTSLRAILEDSSRQKVFYDVRNDADALIAHFQVIPRGVLDVQLLELAYRSGRKRLLNGLKKAMADYHPTTGPPLGGRYEVFETRPLSPALLAYAAQDATVLFDLLEVFSISATARARVIAESARRVVEVRSPKYVPNGRHKALAPVGW